MVSLTCIIMLEIPGFIRELVVEEDPAYNTRSTTNVVLDANNRAEISKKSSYKNPKINTVSFRRKALDG